MKMDNAEEILHFLEEFSKRKSKNIPQELNDYLAYVARTGDPIYQWSLVKCLFKEKLLNVITDFYETTPGIDIPPYPNVDPFNYDTMKNSLLERLDTFSSAPFTVQRICELLTYPRKQYNRVDKFMRAVEKNILVVSTREPGIQRHIEAENGEPLLNGSDNNSDYNVDVEMEDMSWKENPLLLHSSEPQPSSSDTHISVDDIETRLNAKQATPMEIQDKITAQYESVTPPELNITADETCASEAQTLILAEPGPTTSVIEEPKPEQKPEIIESTPVENKENIIEEMHLESTSPPPDVKIPDIKIEDADMTEQRLNDEITPEKVEEDTIDKEQPVAIENKTVIVEDHQNNIDESSSDSNSKDEIENKVVIEMTTSSEENSSSSDNTDGNSNSPKTAESQQEVSEESNLLDSHSEVEKEPEQPEIVTDNSEQETPIIESDNYSISDVKSELTQEAATIDTEPVVPVEEPKPLLEEDTEKDSENKAEVAEPTSEIATPSA